MKGPVAFFFLGETLLIPHLYPVVEALAKHEGLLIDLWVSTSVHERLLRKWTTDLGPAQIRIRRAPAYLQLPAHEEGAASRLPSKALLLMGLVPFIFRAPVVVSAEQTTLWIPALLPMRTRFVNIMHGSGTFNSRDGIRRKAAWRMAVPSDSEQREFLKRGFDPAKVPVVGSTKARFRHSTRRQLTFPHSRPIVLFNPHWQRHRSSWWDWGRLVIEQLIAQQQFNVILAPHQRLVERDKELRGILENAGRHSHIISDVDSFATVDGSYTAAADIYLGDTSSQVIEFLTRPRGCVFLNSKKVNWTESPEHVMWKSGEVVDSPEQVMPALERACARHAEFAPFQRQLVHDWLGDTTHAPERIAGIILQALEQ